MQASLCHLKIIFTFLTHVLNWMFLYQDVISSKPGLELTEGKWSNLIRVHSSNFTEESLYHKLT